MVHPGCHRGDGDPRAATIRDGPGRPRRRDRGPGARRARADGPRRRHEDEDEVERVEGEENGPHGHARRRKIITTGDGAPGEV